MTATTRPWAAGPAPPGTGRRATASAAGGGPRSRRPPGRRRCGAQEGSPNGPSSSAATYRTTCRPIQKATATSTQKRTGRSYCRRRRWFMALLGRATVVRRSHRHRGAAWSRRPCTTSGSRPGVPVRGSTGRPWLPGAALRNGADLPRVLRPLHEGTARAATAEQLMRSRYSAFAVGDAGYLLDTWHPGTRPRSLDLDPGRAVAGWRSSPRTAGRCSSRGTVEFVARYVRDRDARRAARAQPLHPG